MDFGQVQVMEFPWAMNNKLESMNELINNYACADQGQWARLRIWIRIMRSSPAVQKLSLGNDRF